MNILISTTTNWNPGDDFIRYGVKNILNSVFQKPVNYIHYDRNPDYFIDYPGNWEMGSGHHSNVMNNSIAWDKIDLVVLAGSPEFLHGPLKPIYDGLSEHPEILMVAMGVGYSSPRWTEPITDNEKFVLSRGNTLILTRQQDLTERLSKDFNIGSKAMPCPALFCVNEPNSEASGKLCIRQFPKGKHKVGADDFLEMNPHLKDSTWLVHYVDEMRDGTFYSSDPREILDFICGHDLVYSHRLHGAVAALSNGANVKLINSSHRVKEAAKLFEPVWECKDFVEIMKFKKQVLEKYQEVLRDFMKKEGLL